MKKKIVTHNAKFHADDVFAVATLLLLLGEENCEVIRTRDEANIASADYVVDVGMVYDEARNRFDHHQKEGAGERENGIPYASFGLVWKKFGEEVAVGQEEASLIEEKIVLPVDALDNGFETSRPSIKGVKEYTIGDVVESFVDGAVTMGDFDKNFFQAVSFATGVLKRELKLAKAKVKDWSWVRKIYQESASKQIIVLPKMVSWKRALVPTEAMFVVFPGFDNDWLVSAVPKDYASLDLKKPFPFSWSGLNGQDLVAVTSNQDAIFCHRNSFLCAASSQEGALALAEKALNA